jgi:glutaredoxin
MHQVLFALLLIAAASAQAQVYKWKDAEGRTHYGSTPPATEKSRKLDLPQSYVGTPVVSAVPSASGTGGATPRSREHVTIFTTPECGYCIKAKNYLARRGIRYSERDVANSESALREFKGIGGRGVPVILVGQSRMDGYSESSLASLLQQAGY